LHAVGVDERHADDEGSAADAEEEAADEDCGKVHADRLVLGAGEVAAFSPGPGSCVDACAVRHHRVDQVCFTAVRPILE
jgi:hypothetical protein